MSTLMENKPVVARRESAVDVGRTGRRPKSGAGTTAVHFLLAAGLCLPLFPGCASPPSAKERQDRAVKDPFNYSPGTETSDITGGGLGELDGDGLGKDLDNVLLR